MTRYRTIVADPPWPYDEKGVLPWQGDVGKRSFLPYDSMSLADIRALPVKALAQNDVAGNRPDKSVPRDGSILYLWTTTRFLCEAHDIAKEWGFDPTLVLVWCKPPLSVMGGTFPANVEFIIVGRRGSPRPALGSVQTRWFTWPRGEHSAKPEAFLDLVEFVSPGPYLEMFARRNRLGWDTWGNEALGHVEMSP